MKNLFILVLAVITVSCGKTVKKYYGHGDENFQGEHYLSNNSFIEIFQNEDTIYINSSGQFLTTVNPFNDTFAELPRISGEFKVIDGKVKIVKNFNYTSGMDVEKDDSNSDITGNRRTDVILELVNDKLKISFNIYSDSLNSNANEIVAKRELLQE
jgi:hypothetical protein